jgi:cyclophilin family peptidyl-prolyl cis-trans isomerase
MKRLFAMLALILILGMPLSSPADASAPRVRIETSMGNITVELNPQAAPKTVANFLQYVHDGFYDNTIFHRVIKSFMIQGGGFTPDMQQKPTKPPVVNEADNGLKNDEGTIAMARTPDPHSATSQFFINVRNNASLNFIAKTYRDWGYCVFGRVVDGMDVVKAIENVKTTTKFHYGDVPVEPVVILKAVLVKTAAKDQ